MPSYLLHYNVSLSERRAASVRNYLIQQGVSARRISYVGYGMDNPRATNSTAAGRAENRRVELEILPMNN